MCKKENFLWESNEVYLKTSHAFLKLIFNNIQFLSSLWDRTLEVIVQSLAWKCPAIGRIIVHYLAASHFD